LTETNRHYSPYETNEYIREVDILVVEFWSRIRFYSQVDGLAEKPDETQQGGDDK
jgi:hypothetical protein